MTVISGINSEEPSENMSFLSCRPRFPRLKSASDTKKKSKGKSSKRSHKKSSKSESRHRPKVYGREFSRNFYPANHFFKNEFSNQHKMMGGNPFNTPQLHKDQKRIDLMNRNQFYHSFNYDYTLKVKNVIFWV